LPLDELHHEEGQIVLDPVVGDRDDVRVPQRGEGLGLALEALADVDRGSEALVQDLQRDWTVELEVRRAVDAPDPAFAEQRVDAIAPFEHPTDERIGSLERERVDGARRGGVRHERPHGSTAGGKFEPGHRVVSSPDATLRAHLLEGQRTSRMV